MATIDTSSLAEVFDSLYDFSESIPLWLSLSGAGLLLLPPVLTQVGPGLSEMGGAQAVVYFNVAIAISGFLGQIVAGSRIEGISRNLNPVEILPASLAAAAAVVFAAFYLFPPSPASRWARQLAASINAASPL
jgi:hypothetical protein